MSQRSLDKLCAVVARIEQQAEELQQLGLGETAHLLEMAVLDLNRYVYTSRILSERPEVETGKSAKARAH